MPFELTECQTPEYKAKLRELSRRKGGQIDAVKFSGQKCSTWKQRANRGLLNVISSHTFYHTYLIICNLHDPSNDTIKRLVFKENRRDKEVKSSKEGNLLKEGSCDNSRMRKKSVVLRMTLLVPIARLLFSCSMPLLVVRIQNKSYMETSRSGRSYRGTGKSRRQENVRHGSDVQYFEWTKKETTYDEKSKQELFGT